MDKASKAGWYCAYCQIGVDPSEVTFNEAHTACGRIITDDEPPAARPIAPKGFKLVPLTMTDDMAIAFAEVWFAKKRPIDDPEFDDAYAAMLAAAPEPTTPAQPVGD